MAGRRLALLVATDTYPDRLFRELRGPGADVEALSALLADPSIGGYSVQVLHNRPSHEVTLAINGLFVEAGRDDLILLYIAGHGVKDDSGQLYLAMTNSRHDRLEATTVSAQFVRDQMTRSRSEYIAVWLDCCYAGAFPPGAMHRADEQFVDVLPRLSGRGRAVMTASSALEYAYETGVEPGLTATGRGPARGVFTDALIRGLGTGDADLDGDGLIDVDELYRYVYDQVEAGPYQQTPRLDSQINGKLCIATSIRGPRTAFGLPAEIAQALRSPLPKVRLAVLDDVVALANSGSPTTLARVRAMLTDLAADNDIDVAAAAGAHLRRLDAPDPTADEPDEPPVPPSAPKQRRKHLVTFGRTIARQVQRVSEVRPIVVAPAITVIMAAAILAADQPKRADGSAAGSPPPSIPAATPSTTSTTPPPTSSGPRIPGATNLTFTIVVDPIPGYRIGDSSISESAQNIEIREDTPGDVVATRLAAWISVYQPGAYDAHEAMTGESVTIAGKPGFYRPDLSEPGTETYGPLRKPGLIVGYQSDAWYLIQTDDELPKARETVFKVAAAVRFGINRPMRFPIKFGYLPPGLHPCGGADGLDPARRSPGPWHAEIDLCDDRFGTSNNNIPHETGEAVVITMTDPKDGSWPPKSIRIGGRPASLENGRESVDCSGFILDIEVKPSHEARYPQAELRKIAENLTIRSTKKENRSTWFIGTDALPTTG